MDLEMLLSLLTGLNQVGTTRTKLMSNLRGFPVSFVLADWLYLSHDTYLYWRFPLIEAVTV